MKRWLKILSGLLIFNMGMTIMANSNLSRLTQLFDNLPSEIAGWHKSAETSVYQKDNLFEYINGGAELYISYNFKLLAARTYTREELGEIKIDIFDMGSSMNAYGVFQHSREELDHFVAPDVESEYASGLLTFWKGPYYVSILAYPETEEKKKIVKKLTIKIADSIQQESQKPAIISQLPQENLIDKSIRYFHHYIWLNSHYFISDKNILNMDKDTEAVLAKYHLDDNQKNITVLVLVIYPDSEKARIAYKSFMDNYIPDAREGFKQLEDKRWTGCVLMDRQVNIVLNAPSLEQSKSLIKHVRM